MKILNSIKNFVFIVLFLTMMFIIPGLIEQVVELPGVLDTSLTVLKIVAILTTIIMTVYTVFLFKKEKQKKSRRRKTHHNNTEYSSTAVIEWQKERLFRENLKNINTTSPDTTTSLSLLEKVKEDLPDATEIERIQYYAQLQKTSS